MTGRKKNERVIEAEVHVYMYIEGKCRKRSVYRKTEKGQGIYIKGAIFKGRCARGLDFVGVGGTWGESRAQRKEKEGSSFSF